MPFPAAYVPVIGPVVAALVAGATAFLASVLTKELKTSEFRQAWIDALREDIAELIATYTLLADIMRARFEDGSASLENGSDDFRYNLKDDFARLEVVTARIQLRLNPIEHRPLIEQVRGLKFDLAMSSSDETADAILKAAIEVLRLEWKRVKKGEPIFQATKWVSLLVLSGALVVGLPLIM